MLSNVCVIDVGSNTVKASVFEINENGKRRTVDFCGYKVMLVSMIEDRNGLPVLSEKGIEVLHGSIKLLLEFAEKYNCEKVYAFATASLRKVSNSAEIVGVIKDKFNLKIDVISGEDEALYSLKGLLGDEGTGDIVEGIMIDMGGGSTEIVHFKNGRVIQMVSMNFGCVSLFDEFISGNIPDDTEIAQIEQFVLSELNEHDFVKSLGLPLFLVGGSARAIAKIINGNTDKLTLSADGTDFTVLLDNFKTDTFLAEAEKVIPGRSLTVCPAAVAYRTIADFVGAKGITVSESGVREGYLEKIFL